MASYKHVSGRNQGILLDSHEGSNWRRQVGEFIQTTDPLRQQPQRILADPWRILMFHEEALGKNNPITIGVVVHSIPHLGWYKVQTPSSGYIGACLLQSGSTLPLGVRATSVIPANTTVLVFHPKEFAFGIIIGVIPEAILDGNAFRPGWLVQGSGAGYKREDVHLYPILYTDRAGGVQDFSSGVPLDATQWEKGWVTETGVALMVDSFQAFMRVNEVCGLFLNYFDSYCRLTGVNMDVDTMSMSIFDRFDEGELNWRFGNAVYAHEKMGMYSSSDKVGAEFDDDDVQYKIHRGKFDLAEGEEGILPFFRYKTYGGYLGQGRLISVSIPPKKEGIRKYSDKDVEESVFMASLGLNGAYNVRTAKAIHLSKRGFIPEPKPIAMPEDENGDSPAAGYDQSSHKIGSLDAGSSLRSLKLIAGIEDVYAYEQNWRALHPFHYHDKDYYTPQESEIAGESEPKLDFETLKDGGDVADPEPSTKFIDPRYGEENYYDRDGFFSVLDDGSTVWGDGSGCRVAMAGGNISMDAPGDIRISAGRRIILQAGEVIIRCKGSVDISSTEKDIRIKSGGNMQMSAGKGVLIESKAVTVTQEYKDRIGEDVDSSGIVLKAGESEIACLSKSLYTRTLGGGMILDSSRGDQSIKAVASTVDFYGQGVNMWLGPNGDTSTVEGSYLFSKPGVLLGGYAIINGSTVLAGDRSNLIVSGDIAAKRNIQCDGRMADQDGKVQKVGTGFKDSIESIIKTQDEFIDKHRKEGEDSHKNTIVSETYAEGKIGNEEQIGNIAFSFRDADDESQYGTVQLKFLEPRWQQMVRLEQASGGEAWIEQGIVYQNRTLYPWPGRKKILGEGDENALYRLSELVLWDNKKGVAKDRGEIYEDPKLADWETVPFNEFKVIL